MQVARMFVFSHVAFTQQCASAIASHVSVWQNAVGERMPLFGQEASPESVKYSAHAAGFPHDPLPSQTLVPVPQGVFTAAKFAVSSLQSCCELFGSVQQTIDWQVFEGQGLIAIGSPGMTMHGNATTSNFFQETHPGAPGKLLHLLAAV
jgi:hypothetical protein